MPMLKVRCKTCDAMIPTGFDLSHEAFKDLTYTERTVECPICDRTQTWNMDDVDVSIFKKTSK
jgi:endogenous inhibitor of DNA gyrase (YacG/DUF329 family)